MVTPRGQVKILDLGLAKLRGASVVTKAGATVGTMGYMSPEQLRGDAIRWTNGNLRETKGRDLRNRLLRDIRQAILHLGRFGRKAG